MLRGQAARELSIPTGVDGLIGVRFVEATVTSHAKRRGLGRFSGNP